MAPPLKDFFLKTYKLPNQGGTFQSPAPIVQGNPLFPQATWGNGAPVYQNPGIADPRSYIKPNPVVTPASVFTGGQTSTPPIDTSMNKYINPATGQQYTLEEYATKLRNSIPTGSNKGKGDVPQYAGDAMTKPDETTTELETRARGLNIARNDIAVGQTDPYDITQGGNIVYSPAERNAIEKAYAGIYDPTLNDVFARLKEREKAEQRKLDREDKIFATNESIRAWKATTGSKGGSGEDLFTRSQLNDGATRAGAAIADFDNFDNDVKNFYINPPKMTDPADDTKEITQQEFFDQLMKDIKSGAKTSDEVAILITGSQTLPATVKQYFISKMPLSAEVKQKHWKTIWEKMTGGAGHDLPIVPTPLQ